MDLVLIALKSIGVYLFIVLAIRIFGKREITQLSVIDLVFILLISNAVQNAMVGSDNSLSGGVVAASALFLANAALAFIMFRSKKLTHFLQGSELMLIYKGKTLEDHLRKAEISHDELEEVVREHGVSEIKDVDLAVLETDGSISVISDNYQHRTTKKRRSHKALTKQV